MSRKARMVSVSRPSVSVSMDWSESLGRECTTPPLGTLVTHTKLPAVIV